MTKNNLTWNLRGRLSQTKKLTLNYIFKQRVANFSHVNWCQIQYVPVNSKTTYPPLGYTLGIWQEFCSIQWGIWSKIRPPRKDFVILSTFSMCTAFTGHCSSISLSCLRRSFESLWKSLLNVDFLEWIISFKFNEQTFPRQLSKTLEASGAFDHLTCQLTYPAEFDQNFLKKWNARAFSVIKKCNFYGLLIIVWLFCFCFFACQRDCNWCRYTVFWGKFGKTCSGLLREIYELLWIHKYTNWKL